MVVFYLLVLVRAHRVRFKVVVDLLHLGTEVLGQQLEWEGRREWEYDEGGGNECLGCI